MAKNLLGTQYENLKSAYESTVYRCIDLGIDLQIGYSSEMLDQYLQKIGLQSVAIMTAMNPRSVIHTSEKNQYFQKKLVRALQQAGYVWKNGVNLDPKGEFPPEKTCWIPGMPEAEGVRLGQILGQNAFVFYPYKGLARLIWVFPPGQ